MAWDSMAWDSTFFIPLLSSLSLIQKLFSPLHLSSPPSYCLLQLLAFPPPSLQLLRVNLFFLEGAAYHFLRLQMHVVLPTSHSGVPAVPRCIHSLRCAGVSQNSGNTNVSYSSRKTRVWLPCRPLMQRPLADTIETCQA
jgi:hypothetical protein